MDVLIVVSINNPIDRYRLKNGVCLFLLLAAEQINEERRVLSSGVF
jgi:hypothetical protein